MDHAVIEVQLKQLSDIHVIRHYAYDPAGPGTYLVSLTTGDVPMNTEQITYFLAGVETVSRAMLHRHGFDDDFLNIIVGYSLMTGEEPPG